MNTRISGFQKLTAIILCLFLVRAGSWSIQQFCPMQQETIRSLTKKYKRPVPRYTSYPTVPVWEEGIDVDDGGEIITPMFSKAI